MATSKTTTEEFASVRTVARRFEVGVSTIWRWCAAGKFPAPVRLGENCTRWRVADIEAWASEREGAA